MKEIRLIVCALLVLLIFVLGTKAAKITTIEIRVGKTVVQLFPLIFSSKAAEAPSGVLYIFASTVATDGSAGGRNTIGDVCPTEDPSSHFCSLQEIETAWMTSGVHFADPFPQAWVDNPTLLGTRYPDNNGDPRDSIWASVGSFGNCASWTYDLSGTFGTSIGSSAVIIDSTDCDIELPVACCKLIP